MAIRLICVCGRVMTLPAKYIGQHVQCPDCYAMLLIPTREEDLSLTRWTCSCGQRFKARARTSGRKVRCPKCSAEISAPFPKGHSAPVQERLMLDDENGGVQRVTKTGKAGSRPTRRESGDAYELAAQGSEEELHADDVEEGDRDSSSRAPGA
jgi:hypothetical protein